MSDAARLLEMLRDAAMRGDDLAAALRACGLPDAERAAERLAVGATLPEAVTGLVPPRTAALLAGGIPPLATVAALLADEAWRSAERRRLVSDHVAYPLASVTMVAIMALVLAHVLPHGQWYAPLASSAWAVPPVLLATLMMAAPWLPRAWHAPGSGWAAHLDQGGRWARAALAVQWRLTAVLGAPDAERHCRMLSDWHRRAARRRLVFTAATAAALILAAGGGVVLGAARMWTAAPT